MVNSTATKVDSAHSTPAIPGQDPEQDPERAPTVVSLGGGHGLAATLRAMRGLTERITAVVTVADNGGSSGRLRNEFGSLPPGDLRMALSALCGDDDWGRTWAEVMQHRFSGEGELSGHAVGNLLLMALWESDHDPIEGIKRVGSLLRIIGEVLPMSLEPLDIEGTFTTSAGKKVVTGQVQVATAKGKIESLRLIPENPRACPQALTAIKDADWITFGPGSWFSSVMPHLLLTEQAEALMESHGKRIMIFNLPEPSSKKEFAGHSVPDHLEFVLRHLPELKIDYAVADPSATDELPRLQRLVEGLGAELIIAPVSQDSVGHQHDVEKLRSVFLHIMKPILLR
jgi:uncharacterized cofD-like protein